jgi:hypothetical protein
MCDMQKEDAIPFPGNGTDLRFCGSVEKKANNEDWS